MAYPTAPQRARTPVTQEMRQVVREELAALLNPHLERLQALTGERGARDGSMRAVTRGDLSGAGRVNLTAVELGAGPTAADYNKVVADLQTLAALLARMGASIGT